MKSREPEHLLLIAPRWMMAAMISRHITLLRERHPQANFVLLAAPETAPETAPDITLLTLPAPSQKRALRDAWRQLRRQRYAAAYVLDDKGRGEIGYGEAKFWAFAARAKRRWFAGERLTIGREMHAKRSTGNSLLARGLMAILDLIAPHRSPRAEATWFQPAWRGGVTFTYLQNATRRLHKNGGHVLLCGASWDEAAIKRCGWQAGHLENLKTQAGSHAETSGQFDLILLDESISFDESLLRKLRAAATSNTCLCRINVTDAAPDESARSNILTGWHIDEVRGAFFVPQAQDWWLSAA